MFFVVMKTLSRSLFINPLKKVIPCAPILGNIQIIYLFGPFNITQVILKRRAAITCGWPQLEVPSYSSFDVVFFTTHGSNFMNYNVQLSRYFIQSHECKFTFGTFPFMSLCLWKNYILLSNGTPNWLSVIKRISVDNNIVCIVYLGPIIFW